MNVIKADNEYCSINFCYICLCSWKPNAWIDFQHVRFPPAAVPSSTQLDLNTGAKIEVCQ